MIYRFIPLTKGKFAIIDEKNFERISKIKWYYSCGYARSHNHGYLHRFIMNAPEDKEVDHVNRQTTDCREENMRLVSRSENTFNHPKRKNNTTGHVGVWRRPSGNWSAEIEVNYKKFKLGTFKTIEEAVVARKAAEAKHFNIARHV